MASRTLLQIPRCLPTLIARGQATQTKPSAGQGIPASTNFNSATPPPVNTNTTGSKSTPPFGDPATNQSFMSTPMGKAGVVVALSIAIYAGFKMLGGNKEDTKDPKKNAQNKSGGADQKDDNKAPK